MVRPADTPRRAEEGNPPELNDRVNPNTNNERARNNVRSRRMTRRNLQAVNEPVRDRVITRQIIQNMDGPWRRPRNENTEHNSMVLRSQTHGVPDNQRETRNQPRRRGFTTAQQMPSVAAMPTASQLLETIRPSPGPSNAESQPGTSRDAGTRHVPNIQRRGNLHELGPIPTTPVSRPGTLRRSIRNATRPPDRRESRRSREAAGRVYIPPPYWRPDLEDGSGSDEDVAAIRQQEDDIRPCPIFHFSRRMPTPASVLELARAAEAESRAQDGHSARGRGRNGDPNNRDDPLRFPWMRPRRDGSSRFVQEEEFVPAGYFPNPAIVGANRRQPAVNIESTPRADDRVSISIHQNVQLYTRTSHRAIASARRTDVRMNRGQVASEDQSSNRGGRPRPPQHMPRPDRQSAPTNFGASTSSGRTYSQRNVSVGKCPRNLLKARDIPKELRENLRALVKCRRQSARLRGRQLSSDEPDPEENEQTTLRLPDRHKSSVCKVDIGDITQLPSTSGTVKAASNTTLGKRKRACRSSSEGSADDTPNGEGSCSPDGNSQTSSCVGSTTSIGSEQPSRKRKRSSHDSHEMYMQAKLLKPHELGVLHHSKSHTFGLQMNGMAPTSPAAHDVAISPSTSEADDEHSCPRYCTRSVKRKRERDDGTSTDDEVPPGGKRRRC